MYRQFIVVGVAVVLSLSASTVLAQCGCGPAVTKYAPVVPSYTTYYAAAPYVTYYAAPAPSVVYYAPVAPYVTYYAPATPYVTYYAPVARPYVAYYGVPGWSVYGTPRVYVPGQPVRNALRAVTP